MWIRWMRGPLVEELYILLREEVTKVGNSSLEFRVINSCLTRLDKGRMSAWRLEHRDIVKQRIIRLPIAMRAKARCNLVQLSDRIIVTSERDHSAEKSEFDFLNINTTAKRGGTSRFGLGLHLLFQRKKAAALFDQGQRALKRSSGPAKIAINPLGRTGSGTDLLKDRKLCWYKRNVREKVVVFDIARGALSVFTRGGNNIIFISTTVTNGSNSFEVR
jgi:hypothetical protein